MIIYSIIATKKDINDDRIQSKEVLKYFSAWKLANNFKNSWETKWEYNTSNKISKSPCWIDYKKFLTIEKIIVEENDNN